MISRLAGRCLVFAVTVTFVASFRTTASARPIDLISSAEMRTRAAELQHVPWSGKADETPGDDVDGCFQMSVRIAVPDPATGLAKPMVLTMLRPKLQTRVPVTILVPTMDGVTFVEWTMAKRLCGQQIAAIIADVNDTSIPAIMPAWGHEDVITRQSVFDLRTTIDYAKASPFFQPDHVALMGLSLGAITSSYLAGLESDRLAAVVLVLAGGDLPFVMATSDNNQVSQLREKRMTYDNIPDAVTYEEALHHTMRYDPLYVAPFAKSEKLFMIMSKNDTKVPSPMQNELFNALGQPSSAMFTLSHVETILSLTYWYYADVIDFLKTKFSGKTDSHLRVHTVVNAPN